MRRLVRSIVQYHLPSLCIVFILYMAVTVVYWMLGGDSPESSSDAYRSVLLVSGAMIWTNLTGIHKKELHDRYLMTLPVSVSALGLSRHLVFGAAWLPLTVVHGIACWAVLGNGWIHGSHWLGLCSLSGIILLINAMLWIEHDFAAVFPDMHPVLQMTVRGFLAFLSFGGLMVLISPKGFPLFGQWSRAAGFVRLTHSWTGMSLFLSLGIGMSVFSGIVFNSRKFFQPNSLT